MIGFPDIGLLGAIGNPKAKTSLGYAAGKPVYFFRSIRVDGRNTVPRLMCKRTTMPSVHAGQETTNQDPFPLARPIPDVPRGIGAKESIQKTLPRWRNWQTRNVEVVVGETPCWFNSSPGHHGKRALRRPFLFALLLDSSYAEVVLQRASDHCRRPPLLAGADRVRDK